MKLGRASCLKYSCHTLASAALVMLTLTSCAQPTLTVPVEPSSSSTDGVETAQVTTPTGALIWSDKFAATDWKAPWKFRSEGTWGLQNTQVIKDPSRRFAQILRVRYPAGSASPAVSRQRNAPLGGAQFFAGLGMTPRDSLRMSYYLRFSDNFGEGVFADEDVVNIRVLVFKLFKPKSARSVALRIQI